MVFMKGNPEVSAVSYLIIYCLNTYMEKYIMLYLFQTINWLVFVILYLEFAQSLEFIQFS